MEIKIEINTSGVEKAINELYDSLLGAEKMGKILRYATSVLWIPQITDRLDKPTQESDYVMELGSTMAELDPEFVSNFPDQRRFHMTEAERRIKGGYRQGEITDNIARALTPSAPITAKGIIAVGIGDMDILNSLAGPIGNTEIPIWEILQWGTGTYNPKSGGYVVREALQIFFWRNVAGGVAVTRTVNPGFKGREYFVQLDGKIHHADYNVVEYVVSYMQKMVKKYSYK